MAVEMMAVLRMMAVVMPMKTAVVAMVIMMVMMR